MKFGYYSDKELPKETVATFNKYTNNKVIIKINQASYVMLLKLIFMPISSIFIFLGRFIGILKSDNREETPKIPKIL